MKTYHKIIFSGPVGAGKTSAITSISDILTIRTEAAATDETKDMKETTTVALDYGAIILQDGTKIHLYGTPGQQRFDFMWDILTKGGVGLLLLIDGSDEKALEYLKQFIKSFKDFIDKTSVVVGITKQDVDKKFDVSDYRQVLPKGQPVIPVYEIDARNKQDVLLMIEALLDTLDPKIKISV